MYGKPPLHSISCPDIHTVFDDYQTVDIVINSRDTVPLIYKSPEHPS